MITLKKFYFSPDNIENREIGEITFDKGLNIILGERSDNSEKMNSVGKSLLVEMINFCLFSDSSKRIYKIPETILSQDIHMCLELEIETPEKIVNLIIKRTRDINKPIIIEDEGNEQEFEKLEHAKEYIESLLLNAGISMGTPTFRNLVSILIREEKSSYDDILRPYASKSFLDFSELIRPHLYLFGFDIALVDRIKRIQKRISDTETTTGNIKQTFKTLGIDLKTVKSHINDLEEKVNKLNLSNANLKPAEGLRQIQSKLKELEGSIEELIAKKTSKEEFIKAIKKLPKAEKIEADKIAIIYNTFKAGLGDIVKKSIDEVQEFHSKIDTFQNHLFSQKILNIQKEIFELDTQISRLDKEIADIYKSLKADEKIDSLKKTIKEERDKNQELNQVSEKYTLLQQKQKELKLYQKEREGIIEEFDRQILEKKELIKHFEDDLKNLHKVITGNTKCQFDIQTSNLKDYINIDYRIDLDGGSGMDRIRTFMYDILLLLSEVTASRHLGFLIHDNIFPSTGRDDMVQSLNYIYEQKSKGRSFQYIVTLNKDEFEAQIDRFNFKTVDVTRAVFTRKDPFLKTSYREI